MAKNKMVLFSKDIAKGLRICIRNQYSDWFNDFNLVIISKSSFTNRIEYKFGLIGIVIVLMVFPKKTTSQIS